MSHEGMITVTFGEKEIKFKKGTKAGKVLKNMAQMFPPQGVLVHAGEDNLIVTSQEENLPQTEYIYQHFDVASSDTAGLDNKILRAVLRLQVVKKGELVTYGTTVIFSKGGMCLTTNHCLEAAGMRAKDKRLRVGGHQVEILARDADLDIACLQITDGDGIDFDFVSLDYMLVPQIKIQLISYPFMLEEEFMMSTPTVTHGQVAGVLNHFQCTGDYACFPNSSSGAVISNNKLIGIHTEATYPTEMNGKKSTSNAEKLEFLERNLAHKSSLGIFVIASSIGAFLVKHKLMSNTRIPSSSSSSHSFSPVMVSSRLTRK